MKIPQKLKVATHNYYVSLVNGKDTEKRNNNWGITDIQLLRILIDRDIPQSRQDEVFLHELLHTCFHESGLDRDLNDEKTDITSEDVITRLSPVLIMVLKDNKLLR